MRPALIVPSYELVTGGHFEQPSQTKPIEKQGHLDRIQVVLLCVVLVGAGWLATVAPNPPAPLPADAPAGEFSAERALLHIRSIAQRPHPSGSEADAAVRDYISTRLSALGLTVETQSFPVLMQDREVAGMNLMARIPGVRSANQGTGAVALVCHHDSVPTGPGASDDGAGVAALLETARALKAGPTLGNDIMLLFTDGEEAGLDGAKAFTARCPWMKEIGLVLNFEARGVSGPVFMFETSASNGVLIREFGKAAPRPVANSLMYEVYRRMPNDTDLTIFKQAGLAGLNFAFIGEPQHYHAATDDPAHLSARSLQHEGSYALSLARRFGNSNLAKLVGPDAVYFDLFGRVLVRYPGAWAVPLALLATALFVGVTFLAIKRGDASPGKVVLACLAWAANLLIVGTVFRYSLDIAGRLWGGVPAWFIGWPFWFAAVWLTVVMSVGLHVVLRRWMAPANLALGALSWWLMLACATAVRVPGASYVSLWPLLFGLLGVVVVLRPAEAPWRRFAWLVVAALPAMILVSPLVNKFYVALGPQAIFVPMVVLALELGALSLQVEAVCGTWKWVLPATGLLMALFAVVS
jgi:hypothetical protein